MDHIKILKRALHITLNYRVLWIFGILLALTSGGGGGSGSGSGSGTGTGANQGSGNFNGKNPFEAIPQMSPSQINLIIGASIGLACLVLILIIISVFIRYTAETALIRMVDQHETSGEQLSIQQGFRLGWSQAAWKMFLMDLLVFIIFLSAVLVLLAMAAVPLLTFLIKNALPLHVVGGIVSAGLALLVIFAAIVCGLAVNLLILFARRACALENLGVRAALSRGYQIIRKQLKDVILMGVMMFGVGLAWSLVNIPIILALLVVAVLAGGLPALLVGSITGIFASGAIPWVVGGIVGAPIFLLVLIIPASVLGGWQSTFTSSAWTITYREAISLPKVIENSEPAPDAA